VFAHPSSLHQPSFLFLAALAAGLTGFAANPSIEYLMRALRGLDWLRNIGDLAVITFVAPDTIVVCARRCSVDSVGAPRSGMQSTEHHQISTGLRDNQR